MKFFITGTRRGLGAALLDYYGNCNSLEECEVFINCKHDGFKQVELLYKAAELGKRIINIGSNCLNPSCLQLIKTSQSSKQPTVSYKVLSALPRPRLVPVIKKFILKIQTFLMSYTFYKNPHKKHLRSIADLLYLYCIC